jgi:PBP1b-binding outer membrane lipoprotein LpoB
MTMKMLGSFALVAAGLFFLASCDGDSKPDPEKPEKPEAPQKPAVPETPENPDVPVDPPVNPGGGGGSDPVGPPPSDTSEALGGSD